MTKNIIVYAILSCISVLQTGCMLAQHTNAAAPCDDPLDYYNELSTQTGKQLSTTENSSLPVKNDMTACFKLRQAIRLSMPNSKQQNDKKAIALLKDLEDSGALSESDLQFNNMLLQHISQRQDLRNMIGTQDKQLKKTETQLDQLKNIDEQLKKTETQLDQLKNIEVEIDKKERSVTSPIGE